MPFLIAAVTLVAVAAPLVVGRVGRPPPSRPVQTADLRFTDAANGGVAVTDAASGRRVATIEPRTGAFLRVTLSGLTHEQRQDGDSAPATFRLTRWADNRLTLQDRATGRSIELEAFGPTNEGAFARLLERDATPPPSAAGPGPS